jgi:hypothetical protein
MVESRLILTDRDLFARVQSADRVQRRHAAVAVSRWAVSRVALAHPSLEYAFAVLESGVPVSSAVASAVQQLVSELDGKYFELQQQAEAGVVSRAEVIAAFGLARAANSVLFALSEDTAEAAYEASTATDARSEVREVVLSALSRHDKA